ncbi:CD9 antigen-like [Gymnodraco acuticeps]|uniref:Tetraspanin n=1 Tax=Gymnodraco acuticeps TaxID=8218 RepID=A0A6P8TPP8_GYMAC|nr:CD9 antigen-like [Gymnodraco acuticeps]XP_034066118.1 CD9 antigen-like [Gymnodraco acuticeps]
MALDDCGRLCKYTLFIFNLIFALVGFVFLGLGLWLRFSDGTRALFEIEEFNSSAFVIAVTVLIITGLVMLIVVVFGVYGACNEKRCALLTFSVLVTILAVAVVVFGVIAYSRKVEIGLRMGEFYSSIYLLYVANSDPVLAVTLTFIQKLLHCCGATGVTLLDFAKETCPDPDSFWEHIKMDACPGVIVEVFNRNAPVVIGLFVGTGVILFLALICSSILTNKLKTPPTPQYIIQTQPPPSQLECIPTSTSISYSYPEQKPVVLIPLTVAYNPVVMT